LQGINLNRAAGEIVNLVDRNASAVDRMQGHHGTVPDAGSIAYRGRQILCLGADPMRAGV
jgi:hypothetical protein